ncbi:MAG: acyl-CoA carboxylase epsilon subunit [Nocardioidaceae bacterium]
MSGTTSAGEQPERTNGPVSTAAEAPRPLLRVVRGEPSAEELAALVAVVAARAAASGPRPPARVSAWTDRSRRVRRPLRPGPGAWQASAWPA